MSPPGTERKSRHVRSTPKPDIDSSAWKCRYVPLSAVSRCSKKKRYSITSSASNCIELGTASPRALAVFRLMTSSNLVDCITGRSEGFSPLRIRPL